MLSLPQKRSTRTPRSLKPHISEEFQTTTPTPTTTNHLLNQDSLSTYQESKMSFIRKYFQDEERINQLLIFQKSLQVTKEQVKQIMKIDQRSEDWLKYRKNRATASKFGSMVGHNDKETEDKCLTELLWGGFQGNVHTEYGTKMEPIVQKIYEKFIKQHTRIKNHPVSPLVCSSMQLVDVAPSFEYPGLIVKQKHPWLAVSPDGLPCVRGLFFLLEIKCPSPYKFNGEYKGALFYPEIPHYYFDQIQGIMGILGFEWCDFIVFTEHYTQIRRFLFDEQYFFTVLFPKLHDFYMFEYLPRIVLKNMGLLREGELFPLMYSNPQPSLDQHSHSNDVQTDDDIS